MIWPPRIQPRIIIVVSFLPFFPTNASGKPDRRSSFGLTVAVVNDSDGERYRKWYDPDLEEVNPQIRRLLEVYSKVLPTDIVKHVNDIVCCALHQPTWSNPRFSVREASLQTRIRVSATTAF